MHATASCKVKIEEKGMDEDKEKLIQEIEEQAIQYDMKYMG